MEAWKLIDYTQISPIFALGFTTERWGLEPFPGNLLAIGNYTQESQNSKSDIERAWELPYSCPYSPLNRTYPASERYGEIYKYGLFGNENSSLELNSRIKICKTAKACPEDGCYILIEGIAKTTAGPAHSNVVELTHGTAILFTIIGTIIFVIMGCCFSHIPQKEPYEPTGYNPPPRVTWQQNTPLATPTHTPLQRLPVKKFGSGQAIEVARIAELLRQMYTLDIAIWATEEIVEEEEQLERHRNAVKADALFQEIRRTLRSWRASEGMDWSEEEWVQIQKICAFANQFGNKRYL